MSVADRGGETIAFACGHRRRVHVSAAVAEEVRAQTLALLSRSRCTACHIEQRGLFARRLNAAFGLSPIEGDDPRQVILAEDVRAHLLRALAPSRCALSPEQDGQYLSQLIATLNRRIDAAFWIERRMVLWEKNGRSLLTVLMDLLQFER